MTSTVLLRIRNYGKQIMVNLWLILGKIRNKVGVIRDEGMNTSLDFSLEKIVNELVKMGLLL